jgi:hypothetical protein
VLIVPAWHGGVDAKRAKLGVAHQWRENQNPELLLTQLRFSTEQSTLASSFFFVFLREISYQVAEICF